jgi:hypothetical protein
MRQKWSYSSMSLFQMCHKKYYHLRVVKDVDEPPSEQMRYGLDAHKAAEEYVGNGVPLPPQFAYMQEVLDRVRAYKGDIHCEYQMGLDKHLNPCDFKSPKVWWRGIADLLIVNGGMARVIDYKTGKNTYPDTKQLELLALATFKHFPDVEVVKAGLLFVVHPAFVTEEFHRRDEDIRWRKWLDKSDELDMAYSTNVWNPKQNFTCRNWCPVMECAHNGRSR